MVFLAAALGAGALCVLVRRLSPERLRAGLFSAAILSGLGFLLGLRFSRPERLADPEQARSVAAYLAGLDSLEPSWWPGTWASRAVMRFLDAPWTAVAWWLLSVAAAWAAWNAVLALYGEEAFEFWSKGQESSVQSGAARTRRAFVYRQAKPAWRVLLERDAVALLRAPGQRLQALLLGALIVLFVFSLGRLPLGTDQGLKDWLYLPVSGAAQIILLAVSARFIYPAGSLELQASWLLFHAPVLAWDHLRAKATLFSLALLPLSLALGGVVAWVFTPAPAAEAAGLANFLLFPVSLACMNTGLGISWARRNAAHAEEVIGSPSGVLAMVLGALLVLAQNALLILPLHEAWYARHLPQFRVHWVWVGLDLLLWAGMHAFAGLYPLAMAKKKIDGIME